MRELDELRQLKAGRILDLWRESGKAAEESMERALLCNAAVLAECCFFQGEPVFENAEEVLRELTPREMEVLLRSLACGEAPAGIAENPENPEFDMERFRELQEGKRWTT